MTSYWGPLGWMTLHSASLLYPDEPSQYEKLIADRFIELFGNTISCYQCKSHFQDMLKRYKTWNPGYLNSKKEFALFVFRAHNTVNKRIDKPILNTVKDCMQTLKNANSYSNLNSMRNSYLIYLQNNWNKEYTADAFSARRNVQELIKINNEYFNLRTIDLDFKSDETPILLIENQQKEFTIVRRQVGFKNGRLQF
jgi:hypothetical protein